MTTIASYFTEEEKTGEIEFDGWSKPFFISKVNDFAINM